MQSSHIIDAFRDLGWTPNRNSEKNRNFRRILFDKILNLHIRISSNPNLRQILYHYNYHIKDYDRVIRIIYPGSGGAALNSNFGLIRTYLINFDSIRNISSEIMLWASEQVPLSAIKQLSLLPTTAVGSAPLNHLGALAYLGDYETLKRYETALRRGDRLGFVPYITLEIIEKACNVARRRSPAAE